MYIKRNSLQTFFRLLIKRLLNLFKRVRKVLALLVVCIVIGLFVINITTIKQIETKGMNAIITIDSSVLPNNLLFFPTERVRQLLKKEHMNIQDVYFEKKYPHTLIINFVPRLPIAIIATPTRSMSVSKEGIIIEDSDSEEYPIIYASSVDLSAGIQIKSSDIRNALAFLAEMPQDEDIQSIMIDNAGVLRVTLPASSVMLSVTRDGGESARTLQSVLTGFRIKGSVPKVIDLRFDQPVVNW